MGARRVELMCSNADPASNFPQVLTRTLNKWTALQLLRTALQLLSAESVVHCVDVPVYCYGKHDYGIQMYTIVDS